MVRLLARVSFHVSLQVFSFDLYGATQLDTGNLFAVYALVDPTLAHPKLPTYLFDREQPPRRGGGLARRTLLEDSGIVINGSLKGFVHLHRECAHALLITKELCGK